MTTTEKPVSPPEKPTWMEVPALKSGVQVAVLMDSEDFAALNGRRISIGSHGYAQVWERPRLLLLHKWIMGVPVGTRYSVIVDHINRNKLDCRRSNLRLVTPTQSNLNRVIAARELPVGVNRSRSGRFDASITRRRVKHYLGVFDTPEQAAAAVSAARARFDGTGTAS
ncbi:HNH endonuclease [Streptomyces rubiginosohelvolus]|uniref:HNH endonuclease n=1 Tax=Streptomyces rubiginosohelvolus TaxID=67362 RepID=UPI00365671E6